MVGDGGKAVRLLIVPDFMASGRLAVENKAENPEALDDLAIFKARQPSRIMR